MADEYNQKTISIVFAYIFGIIFVLAGFGTLIAYQFWSTIILFIMALSILPPINKLFKNKCGCEIKNWMKIIIITIGFILIISLSPSEQNTYPITHLENSSESNSPSKENTPTNQNYDLEMSIQEIVNEFNGLTKIQQQEKINELKGKRIKTSIAVSEVNKATLSSQYVILQMYNPPYNLIPYAKAFFPANEKEELLKLNIKDKVIFTGEFVSYKEGPLTTTVEFTKSKFISVDTK